MSNQARTQLVVRSHVARDLLQSAALFKNEMQVAWEYVSNGLEYVDDGVNPLVTVELDNKQKSITITDNGRGMDLAGLRNFFIMHGENIDRKAGRGKRGRFGTGKSAAFGIADVLKVSSVRNRRRTTVELTRSRIKSMAEGDAIPVDVLEREVAIDAANGTIVTIEGVHLKTLDPSKVIRFVEKHLAHWGRSPRVFVNGHQCEFNEPVAIQSYTFKPDSEQKKKLGDVTLSLKVAGTRLDDDIAGVAIYSSGNWLETTLAGAEGREMSQYIFGDIDVPAIDADDSPISPFDQSRSMRLNIANETVRLLYAFISIHLEDLRKKLVENERERRSSEEAKRLAREANLISKVINEDFASFRQKVARAKSASRGDSGVGQATKKGDGDSFFLEPGNEDPAELSTDFGEQTNGSSGNGDGNGSKILKDEPENESRARKVPGQPSRSSAGSGFRVEFKNMGAEENRARYLPDERTIFVNLDHPQLQAAAKNTETRETYFKKLAYEIAFSEYALALSHEQAMHGEFRDLTDPIVDIRETINRLARRAAEIFAF